MRNRAGKNIITAVLAAMMAFGGALFFVRSASAATGLMYLTSSAATVNNGDTFTVSVRIRPDTTINGVTATVDYDASKLQYQSVDTSSSAFSIQLAQSQTSGSVHMERGLLTSTVSTDSLIENITFKALAGSGSTTLSLDPSSNATSAAGGASNGQYTNPDLAGTTITLTTPVSPPPTCPSGQTGTPPNCVSSGGSGSGSGGSGSGSSSSSSGGATTNISTKQQASTPPGSTPVTVTNNAVSYTTATITSTSKDPTQVYIRYGTGGKLNLQTPVSDFATSHTIALDPSMLLPGVTYSYVIVATNQQGIVSQSAPATFTTKGLKVIVVVTDKNHKPLANKTVTLHSSPMTVQTDGKGQAIFDGVSPGTHHVQYAVGSKTYSQDVQVINDVRTVGDTQTADPQNFSVVYGFAQSNSVAPWIWLSVAVLIIAAIIVLGQAGRLGFAMQLKRSAAGAPLVSQPIVVGGGKGGNHAPETQAEAKAAEAGKKAVDERLSAIPSPARPTPGTTVTPKSDESNPTDQGTYRSKL